MENKYLEYNKENWNNRVDVHVKSEFYDLDGFLKHQNSLNSIELDLLGDVRGKSILHLQCHFGQDSLSLAAKGAQVTGLDFSEKAIETAIELNKRLGLNASFVCTDVYNTRNLISDTFDMVFTSYGTIGWLPDLTQWAQVIYQSLKAGGRFVFVEFHPVVWMMDDDFSKIQYRYWKSEAIIEETGSSYTDGDEQVGGRTISWNHGLNEVIGALMKTGLVLEAFEEYDYSPYQCFKHTVEEEPGVFRIEHLGNKIPMVYSLVMKKM